VTLLHLPNILSFKILQYCERKRKGHSYFLPLLLHHIIADCCFLFWNFGFGLVVGFSPQLRVFPVLLLFPVSSGFRHRFLGSSPSLRVAEQTDNGCFSFDIEEMGTRSGLRSSLFVLRFSSSITVSSRLASLLDLYRLILQELSPSSLKLLLVTRSESLLCCLRYLWLGMCW